MDKKEEERLDRWARGIMEQAPLESPSPDFTQKLIQRLAASEQGKAYRYGPLLPKGVFVLVLIGFGALMAFALSQYQFGQRPGWFPALDLSGLFGGLGEWLGHFGFSKITVHAVLIFGLYFVAQITLINKYGAGRGGQLS